MQIRFTAVTAYVSELCIIKSSVSNMFKGIYYNLHVIYN